MGAGTAGGSNGSSGVPSAPDVLTGGRFRAFIAVGDSFTEGVGDEIGGRPRGWADLVAGVLQHAATDTGTPFGYANLAVRGKLLAEIVDDQLDPALALHPDLVTVAGGGNDLLRPGIDAAALLRVLDLAIARLADSGALVMMFTGADPFDRLPMTKLLRSHADRFCSGVRLIAERREAVLVDLWERAELRDARFWALDRLHLNGAGHARVAAMVLDRLAVARPMSWTSPVPALVAPTHPLLAGASYYRHYVAPWVRRRLTGTSSGDGRVAKQPALGPVDPVAWPLPLA